MESAYSPSIIRLTFYRGVFTQGIDQGINHELGLLLVGYIADVVADIDYAQPIRPDIYIQQLCTFGKQPGIVSLERPRSSS